MKYIKLKMVNQITTAEVIKIVVAQSSEGIKIDGIRKRVRILDALDANPDTIALEDADYDLLKGLVEGFSFAMASRDLLTILDGILKPSDKPQHLLSLPNGAGNAEDATVGVNQ